MKKIMISSIFMLGLLVMGCEDDEPIVLPQIDLAAESLVVSVDPTSEFEGTVTLTGTVKNVGDNYRSGEGQQIIQLYEKPLGSGGGKVVAEKHFTNLDAGATLEVSYSRAWNVAVEFPPSYILRISYDPDIHMDGNEENDDDNSDNNSIEKTGQEISGTFPSP